MMDLFLEKRSVAVIKIALLKAAPLSYTAQLLSYFASVRFGADI